MSSTQLDELSHVLHLNIVIFLSLFDTEPFNLNVFEAKYKVLVLAKENGLLFNF